MQTQFEAHNIIGGKPQAHCVSLAQRTHDLIRSAIAMLSDQEIKLISRQDLFDALRMAQSASPPSETRNIDQMEVVELRRTLAIVRECFRKQLDRQSSAKPWRPEFN